jgi:hypothetical protein
VSFVRALASNWQLIELTSEVCRSSRYRKPSKRGSKDSSIQIAARRDRSTFIDRPGLAFFEMVLLAGSLRGPFFAKRIYWQSTVRTTERRLHSLHLSIIKKWVICFA